MIDFNAVELAIYTWATTILPTGTPVIWMYQNSPRPTVDYVILNLQSMTQIGWDFVPQPTDDTGVIAVAGDREIVLSIQGYGSSAFSWLELLRSSLQTSSGMGLLQSNLIYLANWGVITDITSLVDTQFERRAALDITLRIAQSTPDNQGAIDSVQVEETFQNPTGATVFDQVETITN
jgi:hypothetical protein